jgi:hypothetical protein
MATSGGEANLKADLIPEQVGPANSRELFRNGATAYFTLPKRSTVPSLLSCWYVLGNW